MDTTVYNAHSGSLLQFTVIMKKGRIAEMLGIEYPIFQGGMAWIADADLAAAVSNAGGLGIIAAGNADADYVRGQIRKAKELTN